MGSGVRQEAKEGLQGLREKVERSFDEALADRGESRGHWELLLHVAFFALPLLWKGASGVVCVKAASRDLPGSCIAILGSCVHELFVLLNLECVWHLESKMLGSVSVVD